MAAPKSNQFWRNRSEHGREMLFASADLLWKACSEYFNYTDAHPWYMAEVNKSAPKGEQIIKVPYAVPYTLSGLCLYLNTSTGWWTNLKKAKSANEDILRIIDEVENVMRTQKFAGAAVGAFNANIISRELGLVDKASHEITGADGQPLHSQMSDEELEAKVLAINKKNGAE